VRLLFAFLWSCKALPGTKCYGKQSGVACQQPEAEPEYDGINFKILAALDGAAKISNSGDGPGLLQSVPQFKFHVTKHQLQLKKILLAQIHARCATAPHPVPKGRWNAKLDTQPASTAQKLTR
jgi:hypothetical protein